MRFALVLGVLLILTPRPTEARCARSMLAPALVAAHATLGAGGGVLVTVEATRYRGTPALDFDAPFPATLTLGQGDTAIVMRPRVLAANLRVYLPSEPVTAGEHRVSVPGQQAPELLPNSEEGRTIRFTTHRLSAPSVAPVVSEATSVPAIGRRAVPYLQLKLTVPAHVAAVLLISPHATIAARVEPGATEVSFQNGHRCSPGVPDYVLPEPGPVQVRFVGLGGGLGPLANASVRAMDPEL